MSASGLVILVDEGQNVIFGQFLGVHPGLRVMDDHAVHPGPEEPFSVANTEEQNGYGQLFFFNIWYHI